MFARLLPVALAVGLAACASTPLRAELAGPNPQDVCEAFRRDDHRSWDEASRREQPDAFRSAQLAALRARLGMTLSVELLSEAQVARVGGAALAPDAGYGERTGLVAATLEVQGDEASVSIDRPEAVGGWAPVSSIELDRHLYGLFGVPTYDFGTPKGAPPITAWPNNPLTLTRRSTGSFWSGLGNVLTLWGNMVTLGIFWWGPRLAGVVPWEGGHPPLQVPQSVLQRELARADAWAAEPAHLAGERWQRAAGAYGCTATPTSSCHTFLAAQLDGPPPTRVSVSVTYAFPGSAHRSLCRIEDRMEFAVPLAAEAPPRKPTEDRESGVPEAWLLTPDAVGSLLGLPARGGDEGVVARCTVRGQRCSLRLETFEGVWEETPIADAAELFLSPGLRHEELLGLNLRQLAVARLKAIDEGPGASWSALRRVPEARPVTEERITATWWSAGERMTRTRALPPGPTLAARVSAAFPAASTPPGVLAVARFRAACTSPASAACTALLQARPSEVLRACHWGEPVACRVAAARAVGSERRGLFEQGCARGDLTSCGAFAVDPGLPLRYPEQRAPAQALSLVCGGGEAWACNDLAFLIGQLADRDPQHADRHDSLRLMRKLLQDACDAKEPLACENLAKLPAEPKGPLGGLTPRRVPAPR